MWLIRLEFHRLISILKSRRRVKFNSTDAFFYSFEWKQTKHSNWKFHENNWGQEWMFLHNNSECNASHFHPNWGFCNEFYIAVIVFLIATACAFGWADGEKTTFFRFKNFLISQIIIIAHRFYYRIHTSEFFYTPRTWHGVVWTIKNMVNLDMNISASVWMKRFFMCEKRRTVITRHYLDRRWNQNTGKIPASIPFQNGRRKQWQRMWFSSLYENKNKVNKANLDTNKSWNKSINKLIMDDPANKIFMSIQNRPIEKHHF